jgi:hypothetical protein
VTRPDSSLVRWNITKGLGRGDLSTSLRAGWIAARAHGRRPRLAILTIIAAAFDTNSIQFIFEKGY